MSIKTNPVKARYPLISLVTAVLIAMACITGPDSGETAGPPWDPADSAWKVVENLCYAYNNMDLDLYMSCFRDDFQFHLLYLGPGYGIGPGEQDSSWGYQREMEIHENMFSTVYGIELEMNGSSQIPWSGDTTGQSLQLSRTFDLKVYLDQTLENGYRASGTALFICRQDTSGDWYIWQWWDQSET